VAPDGSLGLFAQLDAGSLPGPCPGGLGLTTALVVLRSGWVIVGSLPTSDGTSATAQAGCLIVLDSGGNPVETISGSLINGPWDMAASENSLEAKLFVTNVLNGTVAANGNVVNQGTVVRVTLRLSSKNIPAVTAMTVIASGFSERTDPNALVIGPTGLALSGPCIQNDGDDCVGLPEFDLGGVLYVADTLNNRVAVIGRPLDRMNSAGTGGTLTQGGTLNFPLGLIVAPNGNVLTLNGNNGYATEITPRGVQIASELLDGTGGPPPGVGTLFGLVFDPQRGLFFVDDGSNTLNLLN
jgi:DNA-binding beta-propeller fold protein YncE